MVVEQTVPGIDRTRHGDAMGTVHRRDMVEPLLDVPPGRRSRRRLAGAVKTDHLGAAALGIQHETIAADTG
jgi:hypothetical protein